MKIVILGAGGTIPTLFRNLPAVALQRKGEVFLFDCGEATQIQFSRSSLSLGKLSYIFISHLHGDHLTGLPGLLMTLSQLSRSSPLHIFGPPGIGEYVGAIKKYLGFNPPYDLIVKEIEGGTILRGEGYWVESAPSDHRVFNLAYALEEEKRPGRFFLDKAIKLGVPEGPLFRRLQLGEDIILNNGRMIRSQEVIADPRMGRKIVYAIDTRPCEAVVKLSLRADLLVHDGMFGDDLRGEAKKKGHSTVIQAAEVAKKAKAKRLILSHISARYGSTKDLEKEAASIFPGAVVAKDLMEIEIPVNK